MDTLCIRCFFTRLISTFCKKQHQKMITISFLRAKITLLFMGGQKNEENQSD